MTRKVEKFSKLFNKSRGIKLDVGCGSAKQKGFIGMDRRRVPGVDIVHHIERIPWPVPSGSCFQVLMSHVYEHIEPKYRIDVINEIWRVLRPDGQLMLSSPYSGSFGDDQDPTHYSCPNEASFKYFDPYIKNSRQGVAAEDFWQDNILYHVYEPKPWNLVRNAYNAESMYGNIEIIMEPEKMKSGLSKTLGRIKRERIAHVRGDANV